MWPVRGFFKDLDEAKTKKHSSLPTRTAVRPCVLTQRVCFGSEALSFRRPEIPRIPPTPGLGSEGSPRIQAGGTGFQVA